MQSLFLLFFLIFAGTTRLTEARCTGYQSPITTTAAYGSIQSPRYPRSYQDFENCRWLLHFPFDHRHYITYFNVEDVQISHKLFGVTGKKCTGHLSFYGAETDCKAEKSFCNVYYVSTMCENVVQKQYSHCNQFKRRTLIPTEVKFKSDSYYSDRTPQKGFKLQYKFIDCYLATTTTTTTTTTTVATTTTPEPTTTTTTTTTPDPTTTPTTTAPTTTKVAPSTPATEPTTPIIANPATTTSSSASTNEGRSTDTPPITRFTALVPSASYTATTSVGSTEKSAHPTTQTPKSLETTASILESATATKSVHLSSTNVSSATVNENDSIRSVSDALPQPFTSVADSDLDKLASANKTTDGVNNFENQDTNELATTTDPPCNHGASDCVEKQAEPGTSIAWIAAPIGVGILLIIVVAYILITRSCRKKKNEDIGYLVGMENPNYNELRKKDLLGVNY